MKKIVQKEELAVMLYTLLNFIWIALTTFLLGILIISIVQKIMKINIVSLDSILISGLVFATVYAETWSFFYKVRFFGKCFSIFDLHYNNNLLSKKNIGYCKKCK